jgi:hypothetical protein
MVYVAADTPDEKLTEGAWQSLERLRRAGSSDAVKAVAQADLPQQPTRRFVFPRQPDPVAADALHCVDHELHNVDSGSREAVRDFVQWGQQRCPAENYMVVLWGHGYGTDDYDPFPKLVAKLAPDPNFYNLSGEGRLAAGAVLPALTREDYLRHTERHQEVAYACMPDFHSRRMLRNRDVGDALRDVIANGGKPAAVLGMDACTMAMAEVWLEMLRGASVTVGSEYEIPYNSWPYDAILRRLHERPEISASQLGSAVVHAFNDFYSTPGNERTVTLSACDLARAGELVDATRRLVDCLVPLAEHAASRHAIFHARNRTLQFDPHGFIDLRNFCRLVGSFLGKRSVAKVCHDVMRAVDAFVIARGSAPSPESKLALATGLSVYFPKWIENPDFRSATEREARRELRGHYARQVFARGTGWHRLLLALMKAEQSSSLLNRERRETMGFTYDKGRKQPPKKKKKKATKKKKK